MSKTIQIKPIKKGFKATNIKVVGDEKYIIVDESGKSFNKLKFVQVDKNLEVYTEVEGKEQQIVKLEGFYESNNNSSIIGIDSTGQEIEYYYNTTDNWYYIERELPETELGIVGFPFLAVGAGAAGASVLAIAATSDTNSENSSSTTMEIPTKITSYFDNTGTIKNSDSTAIITDDNTPGFKIGNLPSNVSKVILYVDDVKVDATYDATTRILTPLVALSDGLHTITYAYQDELGNESGKATPSFSLTIDTIAPDAPIITSDANITTPTPVIAGTAEAGSKVTLTVGNATYITTTASDGTWSVDTKNTNPVSGTFSSITTGGTSVTVISTDIAGNISTSALQLVKLFTTPFIVSYEDNVGTIQSTNSTASVTDDTMPVFKIGNLPIGVNIKDTKLVVNNIEISTTYNSQNMTLTPNEPLSESSHPYTIQYSYPAGKGRKLSEPFYLTIDTTPPSNTAFVTAVEILADTNNDGFINSTEKGVSTTTDVKVSFNEFVIVGDVITYSINGVEATHSITALDLVDKFFKVSVNLPAEASALNVSAKLTSDKAGNQVPTPIIVQDSATLFTVLPSQPNIYDITDDYGTVTGTIANNGRTNDITPTLTIELPSDAAEGYKIKIYDGTTFLSEYAILQSDIDAGYAYITLSNLTDGTTYNINTTIIDIIGNESNSSANYVITVDTTAPNAPSILSVTDDYGTITGTVVNNGRTDDTTPTIKIGLTNTNVAGDKIQLYNGLTAIGSAYVITNSDISAGFVNITTPVLTNGTKYTMNVKVTDIAGNISSASTSTIFTIDKTAPAFSSGASASVNENISTSTTVYTPTATDASGNVTYSFAGEVDYNKFNIDSSTGVVTFKTSPDYEAPTDSGANNIYDFTIRATDIAGNYADKAVSISVTDVYEQPLGGSAGDAVIYLSSGNLIAPVQVEGKWYYYYDANKDGYQYDPVSRSFIDSTFNSDINGIKSSSADNTYRYATINGVKLALPTYGEYNTAQDAFNHYAFGNNGGARPGTSISNNTIADNPTYNDLLAIWDAYNGTSTNTYIKGIPSGWDDGSSFGIFWSATVGYLSPHVIVDLLSGGVRDWGGETNVRLIVQVLPVTIDLDGDGNISYTQKIMDVNSDGKMDITSWVDKNDGVLIWDKYHDGKVHDSSQYELSQYGGNTDLEGLAAGFDTNHDGIFDFNDEKFAEFKIWQDLNNDGISQDGEVKTLDNWGINCINLVSDKITRTDDAGVSEAGRTTATKTDGSKVTVADAGFNYVTLEEVSFDSLLKTYLESNGQTVSQTSNEAMNTNSWTTSENNTTTPLVVYNTPILVEEEKVQTF